MSVRWHFVMAWLACCLSGPAVRAVEPAAWIWGSAQANVRAATGTCEFRKSFDVSNPVSGQLKIACDDQYVLRMNGRLIGMGKGWETWDSYDVSNVLNDGTNELQIRCRNDADQAGLAFELTMKSESTSTSVVSSAKWEARIQRDGTWDPTIEQQTRWSNAVALGPIHQLDPWGDAPRTADSVRVIQTARQSTTDGPFELRDGDRVLFLGNTLIERAQRFGYLEAALTTAYPDSNVIYRNLGWSGDTVDGVARARFGNDADGFEHLETHVFAEQPTWVFVGYGVNESFAGPTGVSTFVSGLNRLLDVLLATGAQVVLMTPAPFENLGPPLPAMHRQIEQLEVYADAIRDIARQRRVRLVDLFATMPALARAGGFFEPLTDNGIHLNRAGYWLAAQTVLAELDLNVGASEILIDAQGCNLRGVGIEVTEAKIEVDRAQLVIRQQRLPIPAPASLEMPALRLSMNNLPAAEYTLMIDGDSLLTASADQLNNGIAVQIAANRRQAQQLLMEIRRKNQLYFYRWRPQNETYLFLFRKHEQGNNAIEIPQFDPLIDQIEQSIAQLRSPLVHSLKIERRDPSVR